MTDKEFAKLLNQKRTRGDIKKLKWAWENKIWNHKFCRGTVEANAHIPGFVIEFPFMKISGQRKVAPIIVKDLQMLKKMAEA